MRKIFYGIIIGLSYVIPGVCSATTAMNFNEYENIIEIFSNFYNLKIIKKHFKLLFGVGLGIITGLFLIMILFQKISVILMIIFLLINLNNIKFLKKGFLEYIINIIGIIIVILLTYNLKISMYSNMVYFYLSGLIVSLGFILPGLSGSLLMLNMGIYQYVFDCFKNINLVNEKILFFFIFLLIGIVSFGKILKKVIENNYKVFKELINGMSYGSIILLFIEIIRIDFVVYKVVALIFVIILYLFIKQKVVKK